MPNISSVSIYAVPPIFYLTRQTPPTAKPICQNCVKCINIMFTGNILL